MLARDSQGEKVVGRFRTGSDNASEAVLLIEHISPAQRTFEGEVIVNVNSALWSTLYDESKNQYVFSKGQGGTLLLGDEYRDTKIDLRMLSFATQTYVPDSRLVPSAITGINDYSVASIPLSQLIFPPQYFNGGGYSQAFGLIREKFTLSLSGQPSFYPSDRYFTRVGFYLSPSLASSFAWRDPDTGANAAPMNTAVAVAEQFGDFSVHVESPRSSPDDLIIEMARTQQAQRFIYALALIPLALLLLLGHFLFASKNDLATFDLLVIMAPVTLSVLPLHAVLVSPEIQTLTSVDVILGAEVALFVCFALFRHALAISRRA